MDDRGTPQPATINFVRADLKFTWPCWGATSLPPPTSPIVLDARFREANDLVLCPTPAPRVVIKPAKKDILEEMLRDILEDDPPPSSVSEEPEPEDSESDWLPTLQEVVTKATIAKRANGRKAQAKSAVQQQKNDPVAPEKEPAAPSASIDLTNLPDSPAKKISTRSRVQSTAAKRKLNGIDDRNEENNQLAQEGPRPRKMTRTASVWNPVRQQATESATFITTHDVTTAANPSTDHPPQEEIVEDRLPSIATKPPQKPEPDRLANQVKKPMEGAFTQALRSNARPALDENDTLHMDLQNKPSKEPLPEPVDYLHQPPHQMETRSLPESPPGFLPRELEHVVRISSPAKYTEGQLSYTSSKLSMPGNKGIQTNKSLPDTAGSPVPPRGEANAALRLRNARSTPPVEEEPLRPNTPRPYRKRDVEYSQNPFFVTDSSQDTSSVPMLRFERPTIHHDPNGEEKWKKAVSVEDDSLPSVLLNIVKSVHRSLKPKENAIDDIAKDYKTNAKRLISNLSSHHASERSDLLKSYQRASHAILSAFNQAETEMNGLLDELKRVDVEDALIAISHPSFVQKLDTVCRLYDEKFSKYSAVQGDSESASNTETTKLPAELDERVVTELQTRLLETMKKPDPESEAASKDIHAEVDLLLQGRFEAQTKKASPPLVAREAKSLKNTMYDSLEGLCDGMISSIRGTIGDDELYNNHVDDENGIDDNASMGGSDGSYRD